MKDQAGNEVDGLEKVPGAVGVQVMIVIGSVIFMIRYSPHRFRGPTSLGADYGTVQLPPGNLLAPRLRKELKPGGWPAYSSIDLDSWELWSVVREPAAVAIGVDSQGTTFVDLAEVVFSDTFDEALESAWHPIDVAALRQQPVRNMDS